MKKTEVRKKSKKNKRTRRERFKNPTEEIRISTSTTYLRQRGQNLNSGVIHQKPKKF
ncbi:hypothetical protein HYD86_02770 [Mycoplasmopsis bovis]|nr:hypothetical protein [Mycoplasmopsis bovis]QQH36910.1 hypothetical protein HYD86_02770 [Mycoplasmopsis bovis]